MKTIEKQKTAEELLKNLFRAQMTTEEYQHRLNAGEDFDVMEYCRAIRAEKEAKKEIFKFLKNF